MFGSLIEPRILPNWPSAKMPATQELPNWPVVTGTYGSKPAVATHPLIARNSTEGRHGALNLAISVPQSAACATEDVEAGPVIDRGHHRSLGVATGRKVSRRGRSGERRDSSQGDD